MKKLEGFFDILGEILAVLMVAVYIVSLAKAQWHFLDGVPVVANIVAIMKEYGAILLVAIVGMEAMSKRSFVLRIIFYACIAVIVIFLFFPGTYESLIGMLPVA